MKLCEYGCNEEAKYQLKNGKWCCKEKHTACPEVRRKNSSSQKINYKFVGPNPSTIKVKCDFCNKMFNLTSIKRHRSVCFNNPDVKKFCVVCGKQLLQKQLEWKSVTCSHACSNKYFRKVRNKPERYKNYRTICNYYHDNSKCETCGYNEHDILQVHHINGNRVDNSVDNLIFLCPNCHAGITFKRAVLIDRIITWKDKSTV